MTVAGLFATFTLCLGNVLYAPAASATDAPAIAAAADAQALLEFTQAAPVTASEHARIAAETRDDYAKSPGRVKEADAVLRDLLAKLPTLKPADAETIREELRIRLAMLPHSTLEWQILEQHDPIVARNRSGDQVVTARTVSVIGQATRWLAKHLAMAGPSDDFVRTETTFIRDHFATFTSEQQDACTHIARNMAASVKAYASLTPDERIARWARTRAVITGSVPLDAVAVLAMARGYAQTNAEAKFLATSAAMFHLQNMNNLVMGLQGLRSGQVAPHL